MSYHDDYYYDHIREDERYWDNRREDEEYERLRSERDAEIANRWRELEDLDRDIEKSEMLSESSRSTETNSKQVNTPADNSKSVGASECESAVAQSSERQWLVDERSRQCNEVLANPHLTSEDKQFLFMMICAAFSDLEREEQLRELQSAPQSQTSEIETLQGFREEVRRMANEMNSNADALIKRIFKK